MNEPQRHGPVPARNDRPRPAALRVLRELVATPNASVITLTDRLGGHPNSIRQQLDHLVAEGFVNASVLAPEGRGRPSFTYVATLAGRQVAAQDEDLSDQHALIDAVADHVAAGPDPAGAAVGLGRTWGRRMADARPGHVFGLLDVLGQQGFTPTPTPDGGILLQTCPLLEAVNRQPEIVCRIHQGMLGEVTGRELEVSPFVPGGCLVRDVTS